MPIIAKDTRKDWTPAPEGLHQAVCCDVIDLGMVESQFGLRHKIRLVWQTEMVSPDDNKAFQIVKSYTLSLNEKANLRKDLECWRGRKFTKQELEGFDLERLLGVNCQLQIIHNLSDEGRTFSNVQAIIPLGKGMPKLGPKEYIRVKDRTAQQGTEMEKESEPEDDIPF